MSWADRWAIIGATIVSVMLVGVAAYRPIHAIPASTIVAPGQALICDGGTWRVDGAYLRCE